jgi:hypothetical protein
VKITKASDLPVGTPVYFQPIIMRGEPRYAGVTECEPWQLCHGEWVVNLCDMDPAYEYAASKGGRVNAACMDALKLRKVKVGRRDMIRLRDAGMR